MCLKKCFDFLVDLAFKIVFREFSVLFSEEKAIPTLFNEVLLLAKFNQLTHCSV